MTQLTGGVYVGADQVIQVLEPFTAAVHALRLTALKTPPDADTIAVTGRHQGRTALGALSTCSSAAPGASAKAPVSGSNS
jgi:hypothetical protein